MNHARLMTCVVLLSATLLTGCGFSTAPTEVGVRTRKLALLGEKGVENKVYPGGATQFFLPFVTDWHTFNISSRNIIMRAVAGSARATNDELLFKTKDGNDIGLDVTVTYHIVPEKAPFILQNVALNDRAIEEVVVRTVCRSMPRDVFGGLDSEEFYIPENRERKAQEAREKLNKVLEPQGIVVEHVLLGDYRFNEQYMEAIEQKKLADQEAKKLQSETKAVEEGNKAKVEAAKAQVERTHAEADGAFARAKVQADTYYEQKLRIAEAVIAEGKSQAEAIQKMNEALLGAGGEAIIKMELANALRDKRIVMVPMGGNSLDLRTMDINKVMELYGMQSLAKPGSPGAGEDRGMLSDFWEDTLVGNVSSSVPSAAASPGSEAQQQEPPASQQSKPATKKRAP